jgi:hypothetical protein
VVGSDVSPAISRGVVLNARIWCSVWTLVAVVVFVVFFADVPLIDSGEVGECYHSERPCDNA